MLLFFNLYCMKQTYQQGNVKWKEQSSIILKLNFITKYPKRLLYFHTIIFKSKLFSKEIGINFFVELCSNSMITHLISIMWRRLLIMMFPMHQVLMMIEFTHVVGSLNWKDGSSVITVVQMSYSPTDDSYWKVVWNSFLWYLS